MTNTIVKETLWKEETNECGVTIQYFIIEGKCYGEHFYYVETVYNQPNGKTSRHGSKQFKTKRGLRNWNNIPNDFEF